jgi:hypothetical protein
MGRPDEKTLVYYQILYSCGVNRPLSADKGYALWFAEQKVSFIGIDWKGDIVCVAGASGYSANPLRVRGQLETRENPEQRNEYCRSIITPKIEATILTLEKSIPRSDKWERAMKSAYSALTRLEENPPETLSNCAH